MAITINGTGTITGISAGGLPDNCVTAADLATTLDLSSNTVTLPSGTGGKILQIVQSSDTGKPSSTSSTYVDTGLSGTITPSSSSNKVLVVVYEGQCYKTAADTQLDFQLLRDSTSIFTYTALNIGAVVDSTNPTIPYLDSPATTSAITYKTQFRNRDSNGTVVVNGNGTQIMLLMEVAA